MIKVWTDSWNFLYTNYIFHTLIILAMVYLIFFPNKLGKMLTEVLGKFKIIKAGKFELQTADNETGQKDTQQDTLIKSLDEKVLKIEAFLEADSIERKKRQEELDRRLDEHYEYIKEASIKAGIAVVWTDGVPLIEFYEAGISNIKLGANGNLKEKLVEAIMHAPDGRAIWKSILSNYMREHGHNVSDHFSNTIDWIEKRIA